MNAMYKLKKLGEFQFLEEENPFLSLFFALFDCMVLFHL